MNRIRRRVGPAGVLLLGLVVVGSGESAWGQRIEWTRQSGGSSAFGVALDASGNIYLAGGTARDAFVRKYDANGTMLWTQQFGTPAPDGASAVAVDTRGGVYVAGGTSRTLPGQTSAGLSDAFVRKYDADGNELWTRQFGTPSGDGASAIAVDAGGSIYVVGSTFGVFPGQSSTAPDDAFVRKYDSTGVELWTRQFGFSQFSGDSASAVAVDASGSIYVAGSILFGGGVEDGFVRKYNANGVELWTRQLGAPRRNSAGGIAVDGGGSIYVVGTTKGTLPGQTSAGFIDAFVRKYNANGVELWTRQFGTRHPSGVGRLDVAFAVAVSPSGIIHVAGATDGDFPFQSSDGDAFVRKYDPNGNELWTRQFVGGTRAIAVDPTGAFYVAGDPASLTKFVPCSSILAGDVNEDCVVDCHDLAIVQATLGTSYAKANVVPNNVVDVRDLAFVAQKLPAGTRCP